MKWRPQSGRLREFPEIDRAEWFELAAAGQKISAGQETFLKELKSSNLE